MEGSFEFNFCDLQKFMFNFYVRDIEKILQNINKLPPNIYTIIDDYKKNILRIKANQFCIDIDKNKQQIFIISTHDKVKEHSDLFKNVFV